MKVSVLGCGSIGKRHLKGLSVIKDDCDIKAINCFDLNSERLEGIQSEIEGIETFDSLEGCVEGVDCVFICVPTSLHIQTYNKINELGNFHLFIEKPLSSSLEGCDQLLFNQSRAKKHTVIGYLMRLDPLLLDAKKLINSDKIGKIVSVRAECGAYLPLWHPWERYQDFYMSWKTGGGGALLDISHEIDYLQFLFGDIEDVQGYFGTVSDLEITSDDLALGIFKFKNGIIGQLQLDLLQHSRERQLKVIGTKGSIVADFNEDSLKIYENSNGKWETKKFNTNHDLLYHEEYKQFFKEIAGSEKTLASLEDGIKTMQVIEAIRRSSESGNRIRLPLY